MWECGCGTLSQLLDNSPGASGAVVQVEMGSFVVAFLVVAFLVVAFLVVAFSVVAFFVVAVTEVVVSMRLGVEIGRSQYSESNFTSKSVIKSLTKGFR